MKYYASCCTCYSIYSINRIIFILFFLNFLGTDLHAQSRKISFFDSDSAFNPKRFREVTIGTSALYVASMAGLYNLWYKDYPLTKLHTFNDNGEWLQMDKIGHIGSAYYVGKMGIGMLNWTGMKRKKAIWYGGLMGAFFQTSIEVFDGISPAWGFSWGDITANAIGSALLISQQLAWNDQRIQFKYSFHTTKYTSMDASDLLGNSLVEKIFKDYNGQTYWLSLNIASFLPKSSHFPKWLSISGGYGAEGMIHARERQLPKPYKWYRQFYLAPDIDLSRIKTKSRFINTLLYTFGFIKFPLPAIELDVPGKIRFHALYF